METETSVKYGGFVSELEHEESERAKYEELISAYHAPELETLPLRLSSDHMSDTSSQNRLLLPSQNGQDGVEVDRSALSRADDALSRLRPLRDKIIHFADVFFDHYHRNIKEERAAVVSTFEANIKYLHDQSRKKIEEAVRKRVSHEICKSQLEASENERRIVTKDAEALASSVEKELRDVHLKYKLLQEEHSLLVERHKLKRTEDVRCKIELERLKENMLTAPKAINPVPDPTIHPPVAQAPAYVEQHRECRARIANLQKELTSERKQRLNLLNTLVERRSRIDARQLTTDAPDTVPAFLDALPASKVARPSTPPAAAEETDAVEERRHVGELLPNEEKKVQRIRHRGFASRVKSKLKVRKI